MVKGRSGNKWESQTDGLHSLSLAPWRLHQPTWPHSSGTSTLTVARYSLFIDPQDSKLNNFQLYAMYLCWGIQQINWINLHCFNKPGKNATSVQVLVQVLSDGQCLIYGRYIISGKHFFLCDISVSSVLFCFVSCCTVFTVQNFFGSSKKKIQCRNHRVWYGFKKVDFVNMNTRDTRSISNGFSKVPSLVFATYFQFS